MQRSTRQRTTSAVLLSAATLLIVVPALGVLGTAMPGVPYVGLALIILGEADLLVPTEGTYRFTEQARAAGVDVGLVSVPYADHVFDGRAGSIG